MITLKNLTLQRGTKVLFEQVDLTLHPGQRVGITGANGSGKSSLFKLILGELQPDRGDLQLPPQLTIAHVAQETPAVDRTAVDYVLDGDEELRQLEAELEVAEGEQLGHLHARMEAIDGYTARARAARLMHGLGFAAAQLERPVSDFSGGWRMRLNLARALMCRSDLLLLDEPTNHLDLEAVIWLEQWLRSYPGTLLLISHDREFLDAVVSHIAHVEHQRITLYSGNYSDFERQRAQRLAQQQAAFEKQQREMAHLQRFIDRFRAKATKARQAQSRIKALERMEVIAPAHVDTPFHFDFLPPARASDPLLKLEEVAVGYQDKALLEAISLNIRPGMRLGLLGPNGAGKSTLVKLLAGELVPLGGETLAGPGLQLGYFAQHQLEQLRAEQSPLEHLLRLAPDADEQKLRDFLGGFGFHGDQVAEPVAPFSGGEKSRLVLAMLVYQRPNLLLLDEPTNHLDLEMRHALTLALQGYEGALVLVSHDRHLLRTCADEFLLVHGGRVSHFDGDLDDYRQFLQAQEEPAEESAKSAKVDRKQQRREAAERRKRLQPLTSRIRKLEARMTPLQNELTEIETGLADPALYADDGKDALQRQLERQRVCRAELETLEAEWLELNEELEALEAES